MILSCGHAGLALYVILEKYLGKDAEQLFLKHGVHPNKDVNDGIYCSTGSLGMGLSIALGRALVDRSRNVWCLISDGECAEGVVWESLNFAQRECIDNLKVYCNWNGYAAYRDTIREWRIAFEAFRSNVNFVHHSVNELEFDIPFLKGQDAHYYKMSEADWEWVENNS
jgi:transketolase